jgi:uncharacterized protein
MTKAIFPLPIFLLPGGVTRLRVFEPRYIRLVQESAGDTGFVILPHKNLPILEDGLTSDTTFNWGSFVKIIDFEQGEEGLLHIDVQCETMVSIQDIRQESDGLRKGEVSTYEYWPKATIDRDLVSTSQMLSLTKNLQKMFELNPELDELYNQTQFNCPIWVCQRWLEILPLKQQDMNIFAQANSFEKTFNSLSTIIFEHK